MRSHIASRKLMIFVSNGTSFVIKGVRSGGVPTYNEV